MKVEPIPFGDEGDKFALEKHAGAARRAVGRENRVDSQPVRLGTLAPSLISLALRCDTYRHDYVVQEKHMAKTYTVFTVVIALLATATVYGWANSGEGPPPGPRSTSQGSSITLHGDGSATFYPADSGVIEFGVGEEMLSLGEYYTSYQSTPNRRGFFYEMLVRTNESPPPAWAYSIFLLRTDPPFSQMVEQGTFD